LHVAFEPSELRTIARLSPPGPTPPDPSNRFADAPEASRVGRALFYDPLLSRDRTKSCATCHDPAQGWSDGRASALDDPSLKNTPSLWNVARRRWFFWDGRADSLWAQAVQPLESPREMGLSRVALLQRFFSDPARRASYQRVFGPGPALAWLAGLPAEARPAYGDPQSKEVRAWEGLSGEDRAAVDRHLTNLTKAIAAFEREIWSEEAPFDVFVRGLRSGRSEDLAALGASAQRGLKLFIGQAGCIKCHFGPDFSNGEFHNVGLASLPGQALDRGRERGIELLLADPFNSQGPFSDDRKGTELDRLVRGGRESVGAFKTPSLRELATTAPYMHDGRFASLAEVLAFYNELPGKAPVGHREESLAPLGLSEPQLRDLEAFLRSLSGSSVRSGLLSPAAPYQE